MHKISLKKKSALSIKYHFSISQKEPLDYFQSFCKISSDTVQSQIERLSENENVNMMLTYKSMTKTQNF